MADIVFETEYVPLSSNPWTMHACHVYSPIARCSKTVHQM